MAQKTFLYRCAEAIQQLQGGQYDDLLVIFPNRRALQHFEKEFAACHNHAVLLPELKTISEVLAEHSPFREADKLTLIRILLKVHNEALGLHEAPDFFLPWGELLISDFDEIDKYLVNADLLYRNLADLKEFDNISDFLSPEQIETIQRFWRNFKSGNDNSEAKFVKIWSHLAEIYHTFKAALAAENLAYEGMVQRDTIENLDNRLNLSVWQSVVFIGFNQLNRCEEQLFDYSRKHAKTLFYYDADDYYLKDLNHEAGKFLRKNLDRFPQALANSAQFQVQSPKQVNIYGVSGFQKQVKIAAEILKKSTSKNVVWMLPDPAMLLPAMYSLPENQEQVNITMGMSLRDTILPAFVESYLSLRRTLRTDSKGETYFFHEPVLSLLKHPYFNFRQQSENASLCADITQWNRVYISAEKLSAGELHQMVFKPAPELDLIAELIAIFKILNSQIPGGDWDNRRLIKAYVNDLHLLGEFYDAPSEKADVHMVTKILRRHYATGKLAFEGETLDGLQLMGPLETRSLDFDSVYVLNMNEGVFPNDSPGNTYIPVALRAAFGLPVPSDKAAAQSYYFFRLIQNAGEIHLFYNTDDGGIRKAEPSRYIFRIENDPHFWVNKIQISPGLKLHDESKFSVAKSEKVKEILRKYFSGAPDLKRFSPSAVNDYLSCSLKFYYRYLLRLQEPEAVSSDLDARSFGTLLHAVMENLYKPYLGKVLTDEDFQEIEKNIGPQVNEAFMALFQTSNLHIAGPNGQSIINKNVIEAYVKQIVKHDKSYKSLKIMHLELGGKNERLDLNFEIPSFDGIQTVYIDGKIDRVDNCDGTVRVVDYKTGSAEMTFSAVGDLTGENSKKHNPAALQTILYALMFNHKFPEFKGQIQPSLYVLRNIYGKAFSPVFVEKESKEPLQAVAAIQHEVMSNLNRLLAGIFDQNQPFERTENIESCRFCSFASICERNI
jgi:CRISPR/Cas system-associated exonuclease Cas4 (RecB family)